MILADKIIEERKKNGWSQEELADKLGVSRQAVSKWESAGSVPDLQNVIRLAELFGVSTDYLLREDMLPEESATAYAAESIEQGEPVRKVSMEEANDFLDMKSRGAQKIANAVALCIMSPIVLIVLGALAEGDKLHLTEALAGGAGVVVLLGMVAYAVFTFITYGIQSSRMEHLEKESFVTEYGVTGMVKERSRSYEPVFIRGLALGVVLCILAVVPVVIAAMAEAPEYVIGLFVAPLLLLVAVGVNMIIRVSIVKDSYHALLQEGEFSKSEKRLNQKRNVVAAIYWSLTTAVYLAWSFSTMRWDVSWIVWPVAGVLFAAVSGITKMILERKK